MLKKLFCKHSLTQLKSVGNWFITFETSNGLDNAETRTLIFECCDCGKKIKKEQILRDGKLENYKDIKFEYDNAHINVGKTMSKI